VASRRRTAYALITVGGLALAAGLIASFLTGSSRSAGQNSTAQKSVAAVAFTGAQQIRLERGLTARAPWGEAGALAPVLRAEFIGRRKPLLPTGSDIRFEPATFDARSSRTATVEAIVTGSEPGLWQILLVSEGSKWFVIGTRRLR
jgi:hypothetical protein